MTKVYFSEEQTAESVPGVVIKRLAHFLPTDQKEPFPL